MRRGALTATASWPHGASLHWECDGVAGLQGCVAAGLATVWSAKRDELDTLRVSPAEGWRG